MVFSSPLFLFLFLPAFLIGYYPLPRRMRIPWILLGSWLFYGLWRLDFLLLLVGVSAFNYLGGRLLERDSGPATRRHIIIFTVAVNLAILGYFKYANFGIESFNSLAGVLGLGSLRHTAVILPVGISFYIFQAMSYSIDVYRRDAPAAISFTELSAYIALFPQLIAGPIVRYKDLSDQLLEPHVSPGRLARGIRRFLFGFAKKVLIADSLAAMADSAFALASPSFADSWIGLTAYALQLYLDFAAYSDMAIGLGLMLGFRFRENFRQPYHSFSITEFWQRWHISLSTWLRDYLYIPLGGNRKSPLRTRLNLLIVMLLGGLWHGANWTFVIWGGLHGLLLLTERIDFHGGGPGSRMLNNPIGRQIYRLRTLTLVFIGWAVFRSADISGALTIVGGMFALNGWNLSASYAWQIGPADLALLTSALVFVAAEPALPRGLRWPGARGRIVSGLVSAVLFIVAIVKLLADSYSPFLYFQF
jgi:alginate O-acetyltransferase complex protein AlgI